MSTPAVAAVVPTIVLSQIAAFRKLLTDNPADFRKTGEAYVVADVKLKSDTDKLRKSVPEQGKWIFALRERFESLQCTKPIPAEVAGRSFAEYARSFLGGKELNNHAQACGNAMRLIRAEKITEDDVDRVSKDGKYEALTTLSRILTAVNDDFEHPAIAEAVALIKQPTNTLVKDLKAIRARIVKGKDANGAETTEFLSTEQAAEADSKVTQLDATEQCDKLVKAGHLGTLLTEIKAVAQTTVDPNIVRTIVHGIVAIQGALAANMDGANRRFPVDVLNAMAGEVAGPAKSMTLDDYKAKYLALQDSIDELDTMLAEVDPTLVEKWVNEHKGVEVAK